MGGELLEFRPKGAPKDSAPVEFTIEADWQDYSIFGARWLKHNNHVYTVYFDSENLNNIVYIGLIDHEDKENLICEFDSENVEDFRANAEKYNGLCNAIDEDKVEYIKIDPPGEQGDISRPSTGISGKITIDFRNIGKPEDLVLLQFDGAAGRGCDFSYYDAIKNGKIPEAGESHKILMDAQGADPNRFLPGPTCGKNETRWLKYKDQIYLENTAYGPAPLRNVKHIFGGAFEQVCHGVFEQEWKVKSLLSNK
jgi:hypothetical protein